jgi:hypothetical protein
MFQALLHLQRVVDHHPDILRPNLPFDLLFKNYYSSIWNILAVLNSLRRRWREIWNIYIYMSYRRSPFMPPSGITPRGWPWVDQPDHCVQAEPPWLPGTQHCRIWSLQWTMESPRATSWARVPSDEIRATFFWGIMARSVSFMGCSLFAKNLWQMGLIKSY